MSYTMDFLRVWFGTWAVMIAALLMFCLGAGIGDGIWNGYQHYAWVEATNKMGRIICNNDGSIEIANLDFGKGWPDVPEGKHLITVEPEWCQKHRDAQ